MARRRQATQYINTGISSRLADEVLDSRRSAALLGISLSRFYCLPCSQLPAPVRQAKYYRNDLIWVREYQRQIELGVAEAEARTAADLAVQQPALTVALPSSTSVTPAATQAQRRRGRPRKATTIVAREGGAA